MQQNLGELEGLFTWPCATSVGASSSRAISSSASGTGSSKDPMTTAAAIDRLVHHAVILEMTATLPRFLGRVTLHRAVRGRRHHRPPESGRLVDPASRRAFEPSPNVSEDRPGDITGSARKQTGTAAGDGGRP